jgi:hypothetical protein
MDHPSRRDPDPTDLDPAMASDPERAQSIGREPRVQRGTDSCPERDPIGGFAHVATAEDEPSVSRAPTPRNGKRPDEGIAGEIQKRLSAAPDIDASDIRVSVRDGQVTLEGSVRDLESRRSAEGCAALVHGVEQVYNELRLRPR